MIGAFTKEISKSLKEKQENTIKQKEVFKEEANKSLKDVQKNKIKQVEEINKLCKLEKYWRLEIQGREKQQQMQVSSTEYRR